METNLKRQRIVFVNLHGNGFYVKTTRQRLFKESWAQKRRYFLDYLLEIPEVEVCSYINSHGFSLGSYFFSTRPVIRYILSKLRFAEHNRTLKKNGISRKKITILRNITEFRDDDIVLLYAWKPLQFTDMEKISALKVIDMVHFLFLTDEMRKLICSVDARAFCGESNLLRFNRQFKDLNWKGEYITFPFVCAERFRSVRPFKDRKNMAISVGTISFCVRENFKRMYGDSALQPVRKAIKDNEDELRELIACYNMPYYETNTEKREKRVSPEGNTFKQLYFMLSNSMHCQHKQYFSFDMVEKFNEFKMFIVGEEITGVPGIGFVEGMGCGCAYIGLNNGLYEQYGMQEGIHYIGYDGTLNDLKEKIRFWQRPENQKRLEEIASNGCHYAHKHFNGRAISQTLLSKLMVIKNERNDGK